MATNSSREQILKEARLGLWDVALCLFARAKILREEGQGEFVGRAERGGSAHRPDLHSRGTRGGVSVD
jgi:hypothetical protein